MKFYLMILMSVYSLDAYCNHTFSYDYIQASYMVVDQIDNSFVMSDGYSFDYSGRLSKQAFFYAGSGVVAAYNTLETTITAPELDGDGSPTGGVDVSYQYRRINGDFKYASFGFGFIRSMASWADLNIKSGFNYNVLSFDSAYGDSEDKYISLDLGLRLIIDDAARLEFSPKYAFSKSDMELKSTIIFELSYNIDARFYLVGVYSESVSQNADTMLAGVRWSF